MPGMLKLALAEAGPGKSTFWGGGSTGNAGSAAFYNGSLSAALDFDSLHELSGVHADATVIPAAFAIAQQTGASGRDFLAAYVAGAELMFRLGMSTASTTGWFRTATYGVFGAAAASGLLLGLDRDGLSSALGIALGQAAGTQQGHIERKLSKRIQAALSTRAGVFSAQLAQHGITGSSHPFDGQFGLYSLYDEGDPSHAFDDLGEVFRLDRTVLKKFPACGCAHASIEAALQLVIAHEFDEAAIEAVDVLITPYQNRLVGAAFTTEGDAEVTAQFCVQYAVAATLAKRGFTVAQIEPAAVLDPALRSLISRVRVRIDHDSPGRMTPATVTVLLRDGREFGRTVTALPGSVDLPLTAEQIRAKALASLQHGSGGLSATAAERLVERVEHIDEVADMSRFFEEILV